MQYGSYLFLRLLQQLLQLSYIHAGTLCIKVLCASCCSCLIA